MRTIRQLWERIAFFWRRGAFDRELEEEMRFHLEMKQQALVESGMSAEEASFAARRQFGNATSLGEQSRDVWTFRPVENLMQDVQYAVRTLRRYPIFTITAVLTLALGVGINTAAFSVVYGVLLKPLPFADPGRLVTIETENPTTGDRAYGASPADFLDWRKDNGSFTGLAGHSGGGLTVMEADVPDIIPGERVSEDFFGVLGVSPSAGRLFAPEEYRNGSDVVLLSHRLWQRRFGGDPEIVGKSIPIAGGSVTVVGVMPGEFNYPPYAELWRPLAQDTGEMQLRGNRYFQTIARLAPGVTLEQAEADMRAVASRLAEQYPDSNRNWSAHVVALADKLVGDVRSILLILFGATGLVLLISCANVTHLLLARATARQGEIAVRSALGASRWRIVRQLMTENLVLSLFGGGLGVALALASVDAVIWAIPKELRFARLDEVGVDWVVLGFSLGLSVLTAAAFGTILGLKASKLGLYETLKEGGGKTTAGGRLQQARGALVVAQVALTMLLLVAAGLLLRSLAHLYETDLGFDTHNLLTLRVSAPMSEYAASKEKRAGLFQRYMEAVSETPGVRSVAASTSVPLGMTYAFPFRIEGRTRTGDVPQAIFSTVSPGFFRVLGIPILEGREFTERDRGGTPAVAVVNEAMRRRFFAGEDPIGKRLAVDYLGDTLTLEIVGVARDTQQESIAARPNPQIYVSIRQAAWFDTTLLIRTDGEPATVLPSVLRAVRSIDAGQAGAGAKTMDDLVRESTARSRFLSTLLGGFALLALALAAVGIYGVLSYTVAQRTHEIGVRLALGARRWDVLKLVVGQGMVLALVGVSLGLVGATAVSSFLDSILFGVSSTDPVTLSAVAVLFVCVALLACFVPAYRATTVDPMTALRCE